jgi:hypothetical protein
MPLDACVIDSCSNGTAPGSVYCPGHLLAEQQRAAGVAEPEAEAAAARARSEDDLHPGMRKVYDPETGKASWVPAVDDSPINIGQGRLIGIDDIIAVHGRTPPPDPTAMEPHWDGTQWVLRPKQQSGDRATMERIRSLVRELMAEVGIWEADNDER